jgi:hypothetical protein
MFTQSTPPMAVKGLVDEDDDAPDRSALAPSAEVVELKM